MKFSIFFLAILLFASCATSNRDLTEAEKERFKKIENPAERWRAHKIRNYDFEIDLSCWCTISGGYLVSVRGDTVASVTQLRIQNGIPRKEPELVTGSTLRYFHTLDGYYAWLKSLEADEIKIEEEPIYGYPMSINIDFENGASDDEISFFVKKFEILD